MPTVRPLLLVLAEGLGAAELGQLDGDGAVVPIDGLPADPAAALAGPGSPAPALADLGVAIDDRDLWLRPAGRADADALARCGRRPTGPAAVTLVHARDLPVRAAAAGLAAVPAAVRDLGAAVAAAAAQLRQGDPPAVWWLGNGPLQAVHTTFDLAAAVARALPWPVGAALRLAVLSAAATLTAADQRSLAVARRRLDAAPFARHLTATATPAGLWLQAQPGVAFGSRPVAARPAARPTAAAARWPGTDAGAPAGGAAAFAEFAARFWLAAARLAPAPEPAAAPTAVPPTAVAARGAAAAAATVGPQPPAAAPR